MDNATITNEHKQTETNVIGVSSLALSFEDVTVRYKQSKLAENTEMTGLCTNPFHILMLV